MQSIPIHRLDNDILALSSNDVNESSYPISVTFNRIQFYRQGKPSVSSPSIPFPLEPRAPFLIWIWWSHRRWWGWVDTEQDTDTSIAPTNQLRQMLEAMQGAPINKSHFNLLYVISNILKEQDNPLLLFLLVWQFPSPNHLTCWIKSWTTR